MPGERSLHRHLRGFQVTNLADHDDVRVLAHQGPHTAGEIQPDGVVHLHLVEARLDELDRVFHRAHVHLGLGERLQGGIQRGGLTRSGGARDQDDARGLMDEIAPLGLLGTGESECLVILDQYVRVEDTHHQLLAEGGGHGREAQLDFLAFRGKRLDAPVLRLALLRHVHAPEDLDAARHRRHDLRRHLVHQVHHTVDTEPDVALLPPGLEVDIAGPLVEGVLQKPVHDADDVLVVGIELSAAPELHELLEILDGIGGGLPLVLGRTLHGTRQRIELEQVPTYVVRIGDDAADVLAQDLAQFVLPFTDIGVGRGDDHLARAHLHGKDLEPGGIGVGHHRRDGRHVDLQRVDAVVVEFGLVGEPASKEVQGDDAPRIIRKRPVAFGNDRERVLLLAILRQDHGIERTGTFCIQNTLGDQLVQNFLEFQRMPRPAYFTGIQHPVTPTWVYRVSKPFTMGSIAAASSTSSTCAIGGPSWSHRASAVMASPSPQATTSTRPSGRLRAYPVRPSDKALSRVEAR